jgi:MoxR-like ATPase
MNVDQSVSLALARRIGTDVLLPLKAAFVGKDEIVDLLGVCLVAGENLFLLGPPGTAKTAIVHELGRRLDGRVFDYLLTRFTEPNELFGPFDIRKLREGELVTNTEGMLPEADFVFLDELLNANSAILNSLLMVLHERVFRRGRETRSLPLLMTVGASNRLPEDDALQALFDRFLLRVRSDCVADEQLGEVLDAGWKLDRQELPLRTSVTTEEVRTVRRLVNEVDLTQARPAYLELIRRLRRAGIAISDRRAVKLQRVVAASAILCGRLQANDSDLWVVRYSWETDEQREVLAGIVGETLAKCDVETLKTSHPRAKQNEGPDPEELAAELEAIQSRISGNSSTPSADVQGESLEYRQAIARERLAALAARSQWVRQEASRVFLERQIADLWHKLGIDS